MSRPSPGARRRADAAEEPERNEASSANAAPPDGAWRAHLVWLRTAMRRRFGPDLADDITQDAYLRLAERPRAGGVENPRGLLMTVATNLARDAFRRERVRADHAARAPEAFGAGPLAARTAEDDLQVKQAILSLPPRLREVLLLSKIGGLTNREIAQRYGLSVRAVDKRLQKAIALFVAKLRE
jgi:RNA polymerase sigma-70 factor (ECF subfamily)